MALTPVRQLSDLTEVPVTNLDRIETIHVRLKSDNTFGNTTSNYKQQENLITPSRYGVEL